MKMRKRDPKYGGILTEKKEKVIIVTCFKCYFDTSHNKPTITMH